MPFVVNDVKGMKWVVNALGNRFGVQAVFNDVQTKLFPDTQLWEFTSKPARGAPPPFGTDRMASGRGHGRRREGIRRASVESGRESRARTPSHVPRRESRGPSPGRDSRDTAGTSAGRRTRLRSGSSGKRGADRPGSGGSGTRTGRGGCGVRSTR